MNLEKCTANKPSEDIVFQMATDQVGLSSVSEELVLQSQRSVSPMQK
jgi:hypothetical protein